MESLRNLNMIVTLVLLSSLLILYVLFYQMDKINGTIGSTLPFKKVLKLYLVPCLFELVLCSFHSSKLFTIEIKRDTMVRMPQIASQYYNYTYQTDVLQDLIDLEEFDLNSTLANSTERERRL